MKRVYQFLGLSAVLLLAAACSDTTTTSTGGDPLFIKVDRTAQQSSREDGVNIEEDLAKRSDRERNFMSAAHRFYQNLNTIKMTVDASLTTDGFTYKKEQLNQEQYKEGALERYYTKGTMNVNGKKFKQSFYMQTVDNKDKPEEKLQEVYYRTDTQGWEQISNAHPQTVYLYLIRYLIEGNDELTFDDGFDQPFVTKKLSGEQLELLGTFFDLPVLLTPNATYDVELRCQVDEEKGSISSAIVEGTITDLGKTYQVKVLVRPEVDDTLKEVAVDLKEEVAPAKDSDEGFVATFQQYNNPGAVTFYETYVNEIDHEQSNGRIVLQNTLNAEPFMAMNAIVKDKEVQDYSVVYKGKQYAKDGDNVKTTDFKLENYYAKMVNRFVEQYDSLTAIDRAEDATSTTYRETFENDYESFASAIGSIDVSRLQRDQEALYAIDYIVDDQTNKLSAVYLWSITADEESINLITVLQFSKFNEYNPNALASNIDEVIWKALQ